MPYQKLEKIIHYLLDTGDAAEAFINLNIRPQFRPGEDGSTAAARNLNAAFLIALSGEYHPLYNEAVLYLNDFEHHPSYKKSVQFYKDGIKLIDSEISGQCDNDAHFEKVLTELYSWLDNRDNLMHKQETAEKIRRVFFPEAVSMCEHRDEKIRLLREKRKITVSRLNQSPVADPAAEILITSNILVTVPLPSKGIDGLSVSPSLKQMLGRILGEEQVFWYDHPIPVGTAPEHNEVLYGLEGLDRAVAFEKKRGTLDDNARVTCVLSVSVTHEGLQGIVKEYLEDELRKEKNIRHLDIYVFTESDTIRLIEDVLVPAAKKYLNAQELSLLYEVTGVDGEYGRHYSFLKAIAAFWQVFYNPGIKGTFKIDLDQVFPQEELVDQSGLSAFEHFKTPLWGAEGIDSDGNNVELGMIAGALVNQKDIEQSLFTPDVCFPPDMMTADEMIFSSGLPQALSTEAEMMTRYKDGAIDGKKQCIQRIHVTGGTNGILIDALRKYRPFTPAFIGRAEDQAYILSVLFNDSQKNLRYVHKDGLIMRHDKEVFAGEAIEMARIGKLIGDYVRILMFSFYAKALPWPFEDIKDTIDPFTGCFVSKIPLTVIYLRFALKAASFFTDNDREKNQLGFEFLQTGIRRLHETIQRLTRDPNPLIEQYRMEKKGWDLFYDILDKTEEEIKKGDEFALEINEKARALMKGCRIKIRL